MPQIRVVVSIGDGNQKFIGLPVEATVSTLFEKLKKKDLIRGEASDWTFRIKTSESPSSYQPAELDIPIMNGDNITVRRS